MITFAVYHLLNWSHTSSCDPMSRSFPPLIQLNTRRKSTTTRIKRTCNVTTCSSHQLHPSVFIYFGCLLARTNENPFPRRCFVTLVIFLPSDFCLAISASWLLRPSHLSLCHLQYPSSNLENKYIRTNLTNGQVRTNVMQWHCVCMLSSLIHRKTRFASLWLQF